MSKEEDKERRRNRRARLSLLYLRAQASIISCSANKLLSPRRYLLSSIVIPLDFSFTSDLTSTFSSTLCPSGTTLLCSQRAWRFMVQRWLINWIMEETFLIGGESTSLTLKWQANDDSVPRYYRQHCTPDFGSYTKDLSAICGDLNRIFIIDNSPGAYRRFPNNAIPIKTWISGECQRPRSCKSPLLIRNFYRF